MQGTETVCSMYTYREHGYRCAFVDHVFSFASAQNSMTAIMLMVLIITDRDLDIICVRVPFKVAVGILLSH